MNFSPCHEEVQTENFPPRFAQTSVEGFLEELVVRRELADNYCHHLPGE
jgi:hypothetical protein